VRRTFVLLVVMSAACGSSPLRAGDGAAGGAMAGSGTSGSSGSVAGGGGSSVNSDGGSAGGGPDALTDARFNPATQTDGKCVLGAFKRDDVCTCQSSVPNVCDDVCVDLASDDAHCGACGHACAPTSPCVAGVCSPVPATVATAPAGCRSLDLAAVGGVLYWADAGQGTITRLARGEATSTVIAFGEDAPRGLVARGTSLFWIGGAGKQLRRGGPGVPAVTVATSTADIRGLAVTDDAATVYYSTGTDVMRVAATGGSETRVVRDVQEGHPSAIAVAGDRLAFVSDLTDVVHVATLVEGRVAECGKVVGAQFDMTTCRMLARGAPKFHEQIVMFPGLVVWGFYNTVVRGDPNGSTTSPPANERVASTFGEVTGLAATPTFAYFADSGYEAGAGMVLKAPLSEEGIPIRLARSQRSPRAVTVGDERVYWSTPDCAILSTNL
jgi:hypothetical protein